MSFMESSSSVASSEDPIAFTLEQQEWIVGLITSRVAVATSRVSDHLTTSAVDSAHQCPWDIVTAYHVSDDCCQFRLRSWWVLRTMY